MVCSAEYSQVPPGTGSEATGDWTLSQPVWACTGGLTCCQGSRPLGGSEVVVVLAETGELQERRAASLGRLFERVTTAGRTLPSGSST